MTATMVEKEKRLTIEGQIDVEKAVWDLAFNEDAVWDRILQ